MGPAVLGVKQRSLHELKTPAGARVYYRASRGACDSGIRGLGTGFASKFHATGIAEIDQSSAE